MREARFVDASVLWDGQVYRIQGATPELVGRWLADLATAAAETGTPGTLFRVDHFQCWDAPRDPQYR